MLGAKVVYGKGEGIHAFRATAPETTKCDLPSPAHKYFVRFT